MKKTILFWVIAFILTIASAFYQRITGPTYSLSGKVNFDGKEIPFKLERSHSSSSNYLVELKTGDAEIKGTIFYRKFNTLEEFTSVEMTGKETLSAELPAQPPLGKLEYFIQLTKADRSIEIPGEKAVPIRFKGDVPIWVLIPHVIAMFMAMMFSTRAGLEFFNKEPKLEKLTLWTIVILFIGGFPLGFAMNYLAFGEMWGGWPFGNDATDNKTQVAFIAWLFAFYMIKKNKNPKLFALLAAIILLAAYMIPHSV